MEAPSRPAEYRTQDGRTAYEERFGKGNSCLETFLFYLVGRFYWIILAWMIAGLVYLILDFEVCGSYTAFWLYSLVSLIVLSILLLSALWKSYLPQDAILLALPDIIGGLSLVIAGSMILFGGAICSDGYRSSLYVWACFTYAFSFFIIISGVIDYVKSLGPPNDGAASIPVSSYGTAGPGSGSRTEEEQPLAP